MIITTNLLIGFAFNLAVAILIVRFIYYPVKQNKNFVFTFLAFSTTIYFLMSVLTSMELSVGVGFGLFAIFSVLRYRTDTMPSREMTYLFVIIALPVMNSVLIQNGVWLPLLLANVIIVAIVFILEQDWGFHYEASRRITYERIDLIKPQRYEELLEDLRARTGLAVTRCEVGRINFLRDTAELKIYYEEPRSSGSVLTWLDAQTEYVHDDD